MCYVCRCFGWMLDFVQRVLTFALACCMFCAICVGISTTVIAGIAYGYNYSFAEFLTLGRTDVAVYVRRGQFWDKPDIGINSRRKTNDEDLFSSNSTDYEDMELHSDSKPLSDTWRKALDSRTYAKQLAKYSRENIHRSTPEETIDETDRTENNKPTVTRQIRVYAVTPSTATSTTISERSDTILRNFITGEQVTYPDSNTLEEELYQDANRPTIDVQSVSYKHKERQPDIKLSLNDSPQRDYVPIRRWNVKSADYPDEVEEDSIDHMPL